MKIRRDVIKKTYKDFVDIQSTTSGTTEIDIAIGGLNVRNRLAPFFEAYRFYRLGGCKIQVIAASNLPADPGHISVEAGVNTTDPLDILNVGIYKDWRGEPHRLLNQERYVQMLMDPGFKKWSLQGGFTHFVKPMVYGLAANVGGLSQPHQFILGPRNNDGSFVDSRAVNIQPTSAIPPTLVMNRVDFSDAATSDVHYDITPQIFTHTRGHRMGWLPVTGVTIAQDGTAIIGQTEIPTVQLGKIILPQARLTEFYFRLYVTYYVYFKGARYMDAADSIIPYDMVGVPVVPGLNITNPEDGVVT